MPRRRIILAARDHLEQADALLSRAGGDVLEARCVLRHLMRTLLGPDGAMPQAQIFDLAHYRPADDDIPLAQPGGVVQP